MVVVVMGGGGGGGSHPLRGGSAQLFHIILHWDIIWMNELLNPSRFRNYSAIGSYSIASDSIAFKSTNRVAPDIFFFLLLLLLLFVVAAVECCWIRSAVLWLESLDAVSFDFDFAVNADLAVEFHVPVKSPVISDRSDAIEWVRVAIQRWFGANWNNLELELKRRWIRLNWISAATAGFVVWWRIDWLDWSFLDWFFDWTVPINQSRDRWKRSIEIWIRN